MNATSSVQDLLLQLVDEFAERLRRGERPTVADYAAKYPDLAGDIYDLFPTLQVMEEFGSVAGPAAPLAATGVDQSPIPERLGEYRILREVARGGMGIVYEAVQESLGRHVALKVLPFQRLLHGHYLERFRREAKAAAGLHHTNIVPVFGVGEHEGIHFYAMQFIQGQSLDKVLHELQCLRKSEVSRPDRPADQRLTNGTPPCPTPTNAESPPLGVSIATGLLKGQFEHRPAPPAESPAARHDPSPSSSSHQFALAANHSELATQPEQQYFRSVARVGVQVADALAYAHQQGVLHRDIKPSNLLLDTQGIVWVTDFGLAKAEGSDELTSPGDIVGTLRFMAPERFGGKSDPRSDVYSLGLTLYEMLALRPAYADTDRARLLKRIDSEATTSLRKVNRHIPRDLETIVHKAIAHEPAQRYASAAALAEELRRFLADRPILARRTVWVEHFWRWCGRNKLVTGLAASIILLLLALTVGVLLANVLRQERDRALQAESEKNELLQRAMTAELEAKIRGYLLEAASHRRKGQLGQRFHALEAVKKALALNPSDGLRHELRKEAIAALALPDVRVAKEWSTAPLWHGISFDASLTRYAYTDLKDSAHVCRVGDNSEISVVSGMPRGDGGPTLSDDGQFLAVRYHQQRLKVWRISGSQPTLVGEAEKVLAIAFRPDNKVLAATRIDGSVHMLELTSGQWRLLSTTGPYSYCAAFDPSGQQLAIACRSSCQVLEANSGHLLAEFPHPLQPYPFVAWHPSGKRLAVVGGEVEMNIWDVATRKRCVPAMHLSCSGQRCLFTPEGDRLISSGWDGLLTVWDPITGKRVFHTPLPLIPLRFGPGGLLTCGSTHLQFFDLARGQEYRTLLPRSLPGGGLSQISSARVSPDGKLIAAATQLGVELWELEPGSTCAFLPLGLTRTVEFDAQGALIINAAKKGVLYCPVQSDPTHAKWLKIGPPKRLPLPSSEHYLANNNFGSVIANPCSTSIQVTDLEHASEIISLGPIQDARYAAVSPDGRLVAGGSHHGPGAKIWDRATKALVKELPIGGPCAVLFSPDGKWLATSYGGCKLWRVGSWEAGPVVSGSGTSFSHDGKIVAVETGQGVIRLVDPESGREIAQLEDPNHERASRLAFTPDGTRLIAVSADSNAIHVWDLRAIRDQLRELGLDWETSPLPQPAGKSFDANPQTIVTLGDLATPNLFSTEGANQLIQQYVQACKDRPDSARACNNLAWAYLMAPEPLRDTKTALTLAKKATQLEPKNQALRNTLGVAHYRGGDFTTAIEILRSGLKETANPYLAWDLFFLAMCQQKLGDSSQARCYFDLSVLWIQQHEELTVDQIEELDAIRAEAEKVLGLAKAPTTPKNPQ